MAAIGGAGPCQSQEILLVSYVSAVPTSLYFFPKHVTREVEQPGLKLTPKWETSAASGGLTHCVTMQALKPLSVHYINMYQCFHVSMLP